MHRSLVRAGVALSSLLAIGTVVAADDSASIEKPAGLERSLVVSGQGYFPVALRLADGRIAVVLRGGAGHLGIAGRLDMVFSSDEGKTWTKPTVVVDSPADDRNPAFGQAADGTLVVGFYRTERYDDEGHYQPKIDKPQSIHVTRSSDGGRRWSDPTEIDDSDVGWASPYGRIVTLPDGAMLMAVYAGPVNSKPPADPYRQHSYVYRSTDDGRTWKRLSEIGDGKEQLTETSLLRLPSGKLLAAVRSRGLKLYYSESTDDGRTWSTIEQVTPEGVIPGDLCELPDGRVLLTVGDRLQGFGVRMMIAKPGERFHWEQRRILVDDAVTKDCGYPSSVVLPGGRVMTVYYATRASEHVDWGVHCGAVFYQP